MTAYEQVLADTPLSGLTVGQVAERFGVTVRTLHHYDEIGLLTPSERTRAGYRVYTADDLVRLRTIVVYRRLEFGLDEVRELLEDDARRGPPAQAEGGRAGTNGRARRARHRDRPSLGE